MLKKERVIPMIIVAVIVFLIGVGLLAYGLSQGERLPGFGNQVSGISTPTIPISRFQPEVPDIEITPPPSLEEIAVDIRPEYPQLADLLLNPELGSVYKDFYLVYIQGGLEAAVVLARQRSILNENDEIIMTLVLDTEENEQLIAELEAEGIIIQESYRDRINIAIPISLIQEQLEAEQPDLLLERISNLEHVIGINFPKKYQIHQGQLIRGQGVGVTFAHNWHAQGITGQGIKIGILDMGFAGYKRLLGQELPNEVTVRRFGDESDFNNEVHGTACAEIVYEMAPGAELYLAYYDGSDASFGRAVEWLIEQEVDIISNSTGSNGLSPLDGTGFSAELVDLASEEGVLWVNAAGNEAEAHYRGRYQDVDQDDYHEFSSGKQGLPIQPLDPDYPTRIILSWDDWQRVDQDYELLLLDGSGDLVVKSEESQSGSRGEYPVELITYEFYDTDTYYLSIENYDGLARGEATFDIFVQNAILHPDYIVSEYSLSSPADAYGAFSVGAVHWADDTLESYSSQGPTTDGRTKPEISAPSVVDSASYDPYAFDGTSAAAPHVSGAAALVMEAFPEFSNQEVTQFLQERSLDLGPAGMDNAYGAGRLNLSAAPNNADLPDETPVPQVQLQPTSTPRSSDSGGPSMTSNGDLQEDMDALGAIVVAGLCLICLSVTVILILLAALIMLL